MYSSDYISFIFFLSSHLLRFFLSLPSLCSRFHQTQPVWVSLVSQWSHADLGLEVMEPCQSWPGGMGLGLEVVELCRFQPGGVGLGLEVVELCQSSMICPRPWKPRTICIEIHFDWVFAEAHQLEDLFMEP